jgi:hypothetical protein
MGATGVGGVGAGWVTLPFEFRTDLSPVTLYFLSKACSAVS